MKNEERIQKLISNYGNLSRRDVEKLITEKRVKKNGKLVVMGEKATINDVIQIDGKQVKFNLKHDYYILNKPKGYISDTKSKFGKEAVSLINNYKNRNLFTVGRLDVLTTGLIIITNDGELSQLVTSPKAKIKKTYLVWVNENLNREEILKLKTGIVLDDGYKTKPVAKWKTIKNNRNEQALFKITITEGKKNQIRRMFATLGKEVVNLKRVKIENLTLDGIENGEYKTLTKQEIYSMLNLRF